MIGLCNECYVKMRDHAPPKLDAFKIPGVVRMPPVKASRYHEADDDSSSTSSHLSLRLCRWKPDRNNKTEIDYMCTNKVRTNHTIFVKS